MNTLNTSENFVPIQRATSVSSIGYSSSSSSDGIALDCEYPYSDSKVPLNDNDRLMLNKLTPESNINFKWKQIRQVGSGAFGTVIYYFVLTNTNYHKKNTCFEVIWLHQIQK